MRDENAGCLFIKTDSAGTAISLFEPDVDLNLDQFMRRVEEFAVACGYSRATINAYFDPSDTNTEELNG